MKAHSARFALFIFLFVLGQFLPFQEIRAQKADNPVYVNLSFKASFYGTDWSEPGEMYVDLQDETGSWVGTWIYGYPAYQWLSSSTVVAKLYPNKNYTMSVSTFNGNGVLQFEPVDEIDGSRVRIDGVDSYGKSISTNQYEAWTIRVVPPGAEVAAPATDYPLSGAPSNLAAGQGSSIVTDKPIWHVGLGRMRSGESAGAIGFRKQDFSASNFFTPGILYYDSPDTAEVEAIRVSNALRQVYSREVLVDIQTVTSTSYKLDVYPRSQVGTKSGGLWTFSGSPFVTYTVSKITPSGGTGVKITRGEDSVTWETSLELVSSTWTYRDWRVNGATADSKIATNYTTSTAATVSHSGPPVSGTGTETPLVWEKTFTQHSWGKELNLTRFGPSETVKVDTQHSYYTSTGSGAIAEYLKWIKQPNGSWAKFDYYDTDTTSGSRGQVKRTYRQWLDTSATPDTASTSNSAYQDWTYAAAIDGSYRLPLSRIDRAPGGIILSKTEWSYNHAVTTLNGRSLAQSIRYDYWGSGGTDRLTTTTRHHREDDSSIYHRLKPVSVQYPDGRKDSYAYFNGTWTESTKTFAASSGGNDRLILCYHGQTSGGTAVSSVTKNTSTWYMDTVNMVAGKSTVSETVVDIHGRVVFTAQNVYTSGGTLARVGGMIHRFDSHGRPTESVDIVRSVGTGSNELKTVRTWSVGLLLTETAPEGKVTKFEYDSLLRMFRKTDGFGGPTGFPAKITEMKYDGANRVAESYSCSSCGSGATFYEYDGAGRLSEKSDEAPGGGELLTLYSYPSVSQVDTMFPSGADREELNYLDGRPKSVAGTAQPPSTFEYAVLTTPSNEVGFLKVTRKNGSDTTDGWVETKHDLLGRVTTTSVPTWGWPSISTNNVLETRLEYNTAGQLWRERTYYRATASYVSADRIFVYDAGGRLYRRGLDVNNSGTLTTNSNDRIVDVDETISADSWGWQLITTVNTYAALNSSTATEVSQTYTRLTGFNNGSLSGGKFVVGDTISFDSSDRWSLRWDYANPTSKSIESDFQWQGFPGGYQKGNNGYVSEVLGKNGEKMGYEYDSRGRLSHVRGRWAGSAYAEDTAYTYHGDTPFVASVTHGGIATSYAYAWGSPTGSRQVTVTEPGTKVTRTLYNAMDLPWRVWGNAAQPVEIGYDAIGRRTTMTTWRTGSFTGTTWPDSPGTGATTAWVPEAATGLLKEKVWADHTTGDPRKWAYTYTPLGNVATRTWARGVTTNYYYFDGSTTTTSHASHRTHELREVTYSDGTPTLWNYAYMRTGQLDLVSDFTGVHSFSYRSDLQLESEALGWSFYGSNRTVTPTYEDGTGGTVSGRATGFQFKTSSTIESANTFAFSASTGKISTIAGKSGSPTFTYGYATGADWVQSVTSGSYTRTNTLMGNRRVIGKVQTTWNGSNVGLYDSTITDGFDSRGLRKNVQQSGTIPTAGTTTFTYNDRAELTGADFSVGTTKDFTWGYDLMGKRSSAVNNGSTTTYSAITDAAKDVNQYASITGGMAESGLAFDEDGNMKEDGTWYHRYDGENRLKEMERKNGTQTLQFAYDYLNRRVRKTVRSGGPTGTVTSSTKFVWAGWRLTAELNAGTAETGTTLLRSYLWGLDFSNSSGAAGGAGALLGVYQGGAWYHTAYDAMGNLTGYLNTSGTVVASYEYNAYGQIIASGGSATSFAFGFATQYTDHESGLVYYGLRYYQPKHGRFINRDPIEERGGLNLYSFVGNSPSNRWDVLGLGSDDVIRNPGVIVEVGPDYRDGDYTCYVTEMYYETDAGRNPIDYEVTCYYDPLPELPNPDIDTGDDSAPPPPNPPVEPDLDLIGDEMRRIICESLINSASYDSLYTPTPGGYVQEIGYAQGRYSRHNESDSYHVRRSEGPAMRRDSNGHWVGHYGETYEGPHVRQAHLPDRDDEGRLLRERDNFHIHPNVRALEVNSALGIWGRDARNFTDSVDARSTNVFEGYNRTFYQMTWDGDGNVRRASMSFADLWDALDCDSVIAGR